MKKWIPYLVFGLFAAWALSALRAPREKTEFHTADFGRLPVLLEGRIQPLDSVALNSLLSMRGQSTVPLEGNADEGRVWGDFTQIRDKGHLQERLAWQFSKHPKKLKPTEWLLEVLMRPELADQRYIFLINHPDVLTQFDLNGKGLERSGLRYFTFDELFPQAEKIENEARRIQKSGKEAQQQTPYEKDILHLYRSLVLYRQLKNSVKPEDSNSFAEEIALFKKSIGPGLVAVQRSQAGEDYNKDDLQAMAEFFKRYSRLSGIAYPLIVPPPNVATQRDEWRTVGGSLLESLRNSEIHPAVSYFAAMADGYHDSHPAEFNQAVDDYRQWLADKGFASELKKGGQEFLFNQYQPFYKSMVIYILALLLGCTFWLNWSEPLRRSAFYLLVLALIIHTTGLLFRMFLEGRPPVTNLYSSAIFVGWGSVVLGTILERIYKDGIGIVASSAIGFTTLIIAHHLSLSGDTMKMLQAVLDTNFWLATHVVMITTGYASMFVGGFLAVVYILRGVFTRTLTPEAAKSLNRMVYGILCFSTLFSFVGTILGGIWADQSWGRFWGWDPKENGALMIVIWCAVVLHARWGGMVRERGLMALAVFGNIVTSFSWFGVNMLGVGLHSYGFMDKVFQWLVIFAVSQVILIGLALLPTQYWRSFRQTVDEPANEALTPHPSAT